MVTRSVAGLLVVLALMTACSGLSAGGRWTDESGSEVSTDILWAHRGNSGHCNWGSAHFLWIGLRADPPGIDEEYYDEYIRDPRNLFGEMLEGSLETGVELPDDAEYTGYSNSRYRLWIAPSVTSHVFLEIDGEFESWPRVKGPDPVACA